MERSRWSNWHFCCGFLSRFGFFSMTPSRIRLLINALSDDLWRLPPRVGFSKTQLREESNKHHKATFDGVSQISIILGIKFSGRGIREFLGTLFRWTTPGLKRVSGLKLSSWHWGVKFPNEQLQRLNLARLRASVFDKLAHFIWTHPLQSLQFAQFINPEGFRHFRALQVSLFFIPTQPRSLTNCRNTTFGCWLPGGVPISPKRNNQHSSEAISVRKKPLIDKIPINGIISPGFDGSFSPSAAANQPNSVRDVVHSQIQIIAISEAIQQAYNNN